MRRTVEAQADSRRITLVTLAFPDRTLYLASEPIGVAWAAGTDLQFYGGLTSLDPVIDRYQTEGGLNSYTFTFSGDDTNIAELYAANLYPNAALVEVSVIVPGQDFSQRFVVLKDAQVTRFTYGRGRSAVSMTVERDDEADSLDIGDESRSISGLTNTSNSHDFEALTGVMFVQVLGRVKFIPAFRLTTGNNTDTLLIAGHHIPTTQAVIIQNDGFDVSGGAYSSTPINPTNNSSLLGPRLYATIDGLAGTSTTPTWEIGGTNGGDLVASLPGGGLRNNQGQVIIGAGMILLHLCERYLGAVDFERLAPTIRKLHAWDVGVYVDSQVNALELIRDRLLTSLPIREQKSGKGVWFSYHDPWNEPIRADLVDGQQIDIVGDIDCLMDVRNQATVRYNFHKSRKEFLDVVTVGAAESGLCAYSQSLPGFGVRPVDDVIESIICFSDATALMIARYFAEVDALPKRQFVGNLTAEWYWLEAGDVVNISSDSLHMTSVRAQILEKSQDNPGQVTLQTVERLPS